MTLAITMGDPTGIGPEILVKAWQQFRAHPFVWLGDSAALDALNFHDYQIISSIQEAVNIFPNKLPIVPVKLSQAIIFGQPNPAHSPAIIASIDQAIQMAANGEASAIVTLPIRKASFDEAGLNYPGHTEYLGIKTGNKNPLMMLANDELRVIPLTIHMALSKVPDAITKEKIIEISLIAHQALQKDFGIQNPRIAIAGLNPHAGEDGKFGDEEIHIIRPAIEALQAKGLKVTGPYPPDTMFAGHIRKTYDVAITMYHDQGLIPLKALSFDEGVNITLGLPIIRTSPDHGTAMDIAGKNIANPTSLICAIKMAHHIAMKRENS